MTTVNPPQPARAARQTTSQTTTSVTPNTGTLQESSVLAISTNNEDSYSPSKSCTTTDTSTPTSTPDGPASRVSSVTTAKVTSETGSVQWNGSKFSFVGEKTDTDKTYLEAFSYNGVAYQEMVGEEMAGLGLPKGYRAIVFNDTQNIGKLSISDDTISGMDAAGDKKGDIICIIDPKGNKKYYLMPKESDIAAAKAKGTKTIDFVEITDKVDKDYKTSVEKLDEAATTLLDTNGDGKIDENDTISTPTVSATVAKPDKKLNEIPATAEITNLTASADGITAIQTEINTIKANIEKLQKQLQDTINYVLSGEVATEMEKRKKKINVEEIVNKINTELNKFSQINAKLTAIKNNPSVSAALKEKAGALITTITTITDTYTNAIVNEITTQGKVDAANNAIVESKSVYVETLEEGIVTTQAGTIANAIATQTAEIGKLVEKLPAADSLKTNEDFDGDNGAFVQLGKINATIETLIGQKTIIIEQIRNLNKQLEIEGLPEKTKEDINAQIKVLENGLIALHEAAAKASNAAKEEFEAVCKAYYEFTCKTDSGVAKTDLDANISKINAMKYLNGNDQNLLVSSIKADGVELTAEKENDIKITVRNNQVAALTQVSSLIEADTTLVKKIDANDERTGFNNYFNNINIQLNTVTEQINVFNDKTKTDKDHFDASQLAFENFATAERNLTCLNTIVAQARTDLNAAICKIPEAQKESLKARIDALNTKLSAIEQEVTALKVKLGTSCPQIPVKDTFMAAAKSIPATELSYPQTGEGQAMNGCQIEEKFEEIEKKYKDLNIKFQSTKIDYEKDPTAENRKKLDAEYKELCVAKDELNKWYLYKLGINALRPWKEALKKTYFPQKEKNDSQSWQNISAFFNEISSSLPEGNKTHEYFQELIAFSTIPNPNYSTTTGSTKYLTRTQYQMITEDFVTITDNEANVEYVWQQPDTTWTSTDSTFRADAEKITQAQIGQLYTAPNSPVDVAANTEGPQATHYFSLATSKWTPSGDENTEIDLTGGLTGDTAINTGYNVFAQNLLKSYDTDIDGNVSKDEFISAKKSKINPEMYPINSPLYNEFVLRVETLANKIDTNYDNIISADELSVHLAEIDNLDKVTDGKIKAENLWGSLYKPTETNNGETSVKIEATGEGESQTFVPRLIFNQL